MNLTSQSIRAQFFSAIAKVLAAGTVVLIIAVAIYEWNSQDRILHKKGIGLAQYLAKISVDPLIMDDTIHLDSIVNEAKFDELILYVVVKNKSGVIKTSQFASINYTSPRVGAVKQHFKGVSDLPEIISTINRYERSIEVSVPIVTGGETIGSVQVSVSKYPIISSILDTAGFIIAINILVAAVLGLILFMISRRIILDPVSSLADATARLAQGDLTTRLQLTAHGELHQLMKSFNMMAENLQQTTVSREYVNNIIKSMTEALLILTSDFSVKDFNDAANRLLGYSAGDLAGKSADSLFDVALLRRVIAERGITEETVCIRRDGSRIPIILSASIMPAVDGGIEGIVCNAFDISEIKKVSSQLAAVNDALKLEVEQRKQAQDEALWLNDDLERQKEALEAANRELESFSYSVSHDLRAPLRHINGFSVMLKEDYRDALDEDGCQIIDRICSASTHMGTLIDDLLRFSRVSRAELHTVDVDMTRTAEKIVDMFRESDSTRSGTMVKVSPGLMVKGDPALLEMVLQNLIGNAWKYSSRNPDAAICFGSIDQDGETVFYVRDNGVGFDMKYSLKLFKVFERLHGEDFEGTGIGLATVKRIVERHGGRIWAESEVGKGATFFFTIRGSH
jgi:PAS domain S-box-containing protein